MRKAEKRERESSSIRKNKPESKDGGITSFEFEMVLNAYSILISLQTLLKRTETFIFTGDKSFLHGIVESRNEYLAALDKLDSMELKEEIRQVIKKIRSALDRGREANLKVIAAAEEGDLQTARQYFDSIADPTADKVEGAIAELVKIMKVPGLVTELVDRAAEISDFNFEKVLHANAVLVSLQEVLKETSKIVYTKDTSSIPVVLEHRTRYQDALDKLQRLAGNADEEKIINTIAAALTVGRKANNELFHAVKVGNFDEAKRLFTQIVDPTIDKIQASVTELVKRALPLKSRSAHLSGILNESIDSILDSLHECIMVMDADSTITYLNPAFINHFGISEEEMLWKKLSDIEPQAKALRVLRTKQSITGGFDALQFLGKHILFDANCIKRAGEVVGLVVIIRDISDLLRLDKLIKQYEGPDDGAELTKDALPESFRSIIGTSPKLLKTLWFAAEVAPTEAPVLIEGESGVGKELVAWAIHNSSPRSGKAMISVNCAAIPETLYESELFGYDDGAFTGARKAGKPGKFELANGGTIFLDEIGDMPLIMQSKLLRVLQERTIDHLGGVKQIPVDVRIITATNKNLAEMVEEKKFRKDLFYRLNVINILIPPLRERIEDIPELAQEFIRRYNSNLKLSLGVMRAFYNHAWQGNVRELKNVIYHSVIICKQDEIGLKHLPAYLLESIKDDGTSADQFSPEVVQPPLDAYVSQSEKDAILSALGKCDNNRSQAMEMLGISRGTFYKKLKKYNIS